MSCCCVSKRIAHREVRGAARAAEGTVPGWDVAGTVITPAQFGASPATGTRIVALLDSGGWAERVAVPVSRAAVIPEGVTTEVAATLPIAGLTVVRALELAEPLQASACHHGRIGGVGQL
jgi:NADPH:quinone reductase-like Zn-dependent oxidoreductase